MNEWLTPATAIGLITALGLGALGPKLINSLWKFLTGAEARKRAEVERLRDRVTECEAEKDEEQAFRRILQESLAEHRIVAVNHGIPIHDLPPFPGRPPKKKEEE